MTHYEILFEFDLENFEVTYYNLAGYSEVKGLARQPAPLDIYGLA
jgi:hypothetical protein